MNGGVPSLSLIIYNCTMRSLSLFLVLFKMALAFMKDSTWQPMNQREKCDENVMMEYGGGICATLLEYGED